MMVCHVRLQPISVVGFNNVDRPNDDWIALMGSQDLFEQPFAVYFETLKGSTVLLWCDVLSFVPGQHC